MKNPKYHVYLTNEERSEVLKSLIDLKNEMIAQGKYNTLFSRQWQHKLTSVSIQSQEAADYPC